MKLPANLTAQTWMIDPEYYYFQSCDCAPVCFSFVLICDRECLLPGGVAWVP